MARKRKLTMGVINITMHPHRPELYVELLKDAKRLKCSSEIGNLQTMLINRASSLEIGAKVDAPILSGTMVRFQNIDMDALWYDVINSDVAQEQDLEAINIPPNLKPNTSLFEFVFFPESHKFFYEMESKDAKISPTHMEKALRTILNHPELEKKYGRVDVTNIPEIDKLVQALALKSISSVKVQVTRPNADHFQDIERDFLAQMNEENVSDLFIEKRAVKGGALVVTQKIRDLAKIAERNGHAEIKGHDENGHPISFSTKSHPARISDYFDAGKETTLSFLVKMARKFLG